MWGIAMAERTGSVRKAPKSAIPAQSATKTEKTGSRVTGTAKAEAAATRTRKSATPADLGGDQPHVVPARLA